ncbi:hypothetical protein DRN74_01670 [Candidatus Micrarchaeota archaeon]|nr:MAG: hypothetical protein DRN74_01670 [Candidatus Micrarchaeota archaeon]
MLLKLVKSKGQLSIELLFIISILILLCSSITLDALATSSRMFDISHVKDAVNTYLYKKGIEDKACLSMRLSALSVKQNTVYVRIDGDKSCKPSSDELLYLIKKENPSFALSVEVI